MIGPALPRRHATNLRRLQHTLDLRTHSSFMRVWGKCAPFWAHAVFRASGLLLLWEGAVGEACGSVAVGSRKPLAAWTRFVGVVS